MYIASSKISTTLSVLCTFRSQASVSIATILRFKMAPAIAQKQITQLKILHLGEQQTLDREKVQHKFQ